MQDNRRTHHEDTLQTPPQQHQDGVFQHHTQRDLALHDGFQSQDPYQTGDACERIQFVPVEGTSHQHWHQCEPHVQTFKVQQEEGFHSAVHQGGLPFGPVYPGDPQGPHPHRQFQHPYPEHPEPRDWCARWL